MGAGTSKEVKEVLPQDGTRLFALLEAEEPREKTMLSIFEHATSPTELPSVKDAVDNGAKLLKVLRHPSVVKFQWLQKSDGCISVVMEHVRPLLEEELSQCNADELCLGLHSVAQGLSFLHDKCSLAHCNLSVDALFVGMEDNGWRLAGLEFAYPPDDVTEQSLATTKSLRSEDSVTPEEEAGKAGTSSAYSKDMYAFGALAAVILGERNLDDPAASRFLASTIEGRLLSSEPADRPPIATLLRDEYFTRNELVRITTFLDQMTLKCPKEKEQFARTLLPNLRKFEARTVVRHLLKPLLSRVMLAEPSMFDVIQDILKPNAVVPEQEYRSAVIPHLLELYQVHDRDIRLTLLPSIGSYFELFSSEERDNIVLPEVRLGLSDLDDTLLQGSLQALADLAGSYHGSIMGGARTKIFSSRGKASAPLRKREPPARSAFTALPKRSATPEVADHESDSGAAAWPDAHPPENVATSEIAESVGHVSTVGTASVGQVDENDAWGNDDGWGNDDDGWGRNGGDDGAGPAAEGLVGDAGDDDDASDYEETAEEKEARIALEAERERKRAEAKAKRQEERERRQREREEKEREREAEKEKRPQKKGGLKIGKAKVIKKKSDGDSEDGKKSPATTAPAVTQSTPPAAKTPPAKPEAQPAPPEAEEELDYFASVGLDSIAAIEPPSTSLLSSQVDDEPLSTSAPKTGSSRLGALSLAAAADGDGEDGWDMQEDGWLTDEMDSDN